MSENKRKILTLEQMIEAHKKNAGKIDALSKKVETLAAAGGEPNVITGVKVNGEPVAVTDKAVDITVPTKVTDITNDAQYQTAAQVAAAVAAADHLSRKKVASLADIDLTAEDADRYIYMVPNADAQDGNLYDEYQVIDGNLEFMGNTAVDLAGYVQKEDGKGLSSNDFTDAEKAKLAGFEIATDEEVAAALAEIYGEDAEDAE